MKKVNSYTKETWEKLEFIAVWKKASNFVARTWNKLIADFSSDFSDNIEPLFTKRISKMLRDEFLEGEAFDEMIESLTLQAQEESLSNLK